ncbi:LANO_0B04236g1_1 [Lachancea nothofagi CBS 11611]|uniref:LANO_0B04236g1_1 n=1 Tax=Lachancea nothofagi CBS 11611 TaxID=1266666 RepID=A0A1G4IY02_9SACH|nr:LANO_0B04236g1_1 [Lachancea nothofagi CBS 11611]
MNIKNLIMGDQHQLSRVFDLPSGKNRRVKAQPRAKNYNQVQPISLGQQRHSTSNGAGEVKTSMTDKEKTELLQRIIEDSGQSHPSGMREFILGCFQLAEHNNFDQRSNVVLVQQLKDLVGKAYVEKKEYVNDWWSQTLPCLTKNHLELRLVCDRVNPPPVGHRPLPPPPPPPPASLPEKTPLPPKMKGKVSKPVQPKKVLSSTLTKMKDSKEAERRKKRMERFSDTSNNTKKNRNDSDENFANLNAISTNFYKFDKNKPVVGRCQTLEKKYLRLTSEPKPDLVRPLNVLKKAFELIMRKHKNKEASYSYLCDQFKSLRQDLRIQIIENQFTLKVYQTHARLALENNDIGEFNQCQSRLGQLFELPNITKSNLEEFVNYRILYYLMMNNHNSVNELKLKYLAAENLAVYRHPVVRHALEMARSLLVGDYHSFFKLYSMTSGPSKCLVNTFINRERLRALDTISKSYNQVPLSFLFPEFQLGNCETGLSFLSQLGLEEHIIIKNKGQHDEYALLNTKSCRFSIIQQYEKAKRVDIKGQI